MRKRGYEVLLLITYIAMAAVFVYLNFFTKTQAGDLTNIIVNLVMFVLVAMILFSACVKGLLPASRMTADLIMVTMKIENDARNSHRFLWEKYREDKEELFTSNILRRQYQDYRFELERIIHTDKTYYKCDIEDYIGMDLVDSVIHRERLNQVAGVMTGLGILGTFIGLSLGLQSFNTGTTAEITNSIEPLMEGIKVAFHTSIYGMVFSLIFNYVYKRRLDDAENAVRDFLSAYRKYVMPDTATDGFNRLMELQRQQTDAIVGISDTLANQLAKGLKDLLEPEFDRFDRTIESFATMATRNQMKQLARVVDAFLEEMNRSLGDTFTKLSEKVDSTMVMQEANERQMQEFYEKSIGTAGNMSTVTAQTKEVANSMKQYAENVAALERDIRDTLGKLQQLIEAIPVEVNDTFNIINDNLQIVETHFKNTIEDINNTVVRVPEAVDYSYRGIEQALDSVTAALEELKNTIRNAESDDKW
ncbi:MAG: MotA/TolQ/ExbB proton channel family protein [Lachnospiraceae bacterium]|nr:MotA/TolQ/ExbB proton channel family protein [Lachnospiraceae bacterium]